MAYLVPSEFVTKMVDAGESKIFMSTRDTVVRAYMAGAMLTLAAWFAVTMSVNTGQPIIGALLFPVGIACVVLGGHDRFQPVVVAGALTVLLGKLLFAVIVFRTTRERQQMSGAAAGASAAE